MQGRVTLGAVLAATMAASTFMLTVFGVLSSELIAEFDVERWQVGALVTASSAAAGLLSPAVGHRVDGFGARASTVGALVLAAAALAAIAAAPTYLLLVAAALLTAVPQAMANPATNKVIAEQIAHGSRGIVTGVKQSGVQVGVFLGGLTLPALAAMAGWRVAVLVFAAAAAAAALVARATLPDDGDLHGDDEQPEGDRAPRGRARLADLPPLVRRITVYGFLLGVGGSTLVTWLPLYAQEGLGTTAGTAGFAVALAGAFGVVARIAWGRAAELRLGSLTSLRIIGLLAVLAPLALLAAGATTSPLLALLWAAAVLTGVSANSWNAVGMLAIIQGMPSRDTGRASGVVMFGFLAGLGIGAPTFGLSVDLTGSYVLGWSATAVVFAASLLVLRGADEPVPLGATSTAGRGS